MPSRRKSRVKAGPGAHLRPRGAFGVRSPGDGGGPPPVETFNRITPEGDIRTTPEGDTRVYPSGV